MKRIAVVGAGSAGLAFATVARQRGHQVVLYEADNEIGGQFNIVKQIPGKQEFYETLRYFKQQIELLNIDVIKHKKPIGQSVAILGAGSIGFDVAEYLCAKENNGTQQKEDWLRSWGVDMDSRSAGGLLTKLDKVHGRRDITLLQRKQTKIGATLGKSTGWIHRMNLKKHGVKMVNGVSYKRIDAEGFHVVINNREKYFKVDNVILCVGQEPRRDLYQGLIDTGLRVELIGGADVATELDAKRAIDQASRLAAEI